MRSWFLKAALVGALVAGCDRSDDSSAPPAGATPPAPTTQGAAGAPADPPLEVANVTLDAPATLPATQALNTIILVDNKPLVFPPAKLQLSTKSGQVVAMLFSDDPKTAINDDYAGNSFYFSFPLQIADVAELDGATYTPAPASNEMEETPYGIFLNGNRQQLQAQLLAVKFEQDGPQITVKLNGRFNSFDMTADTKAARELPVSARISPEMIVRDK